MNIDTSFYVIVLMTISVGVLLVVGVINEKLSIREMVDSYKIMIMHIAEKIRQSSYVGVKSHKNISMKSNVMDSPRTFFLLLAVTSELKLPLITFRLI